MLTDHPTSDHNREALNRVVELGKKIYDGRMSFAKWYDQMVMENGTHVRPHLRAAWAQIKSQTCKAPGKNQPNGR